jgi:hypothetical protein
VKRFKAPLSLLEQMSFEQLSRRVNKFFRFKFSHKVLRERKRIIPRELTWSSIPIPHCNNLMTCAVKHSAVIFVVGSDLVVFSIILFSKKNILGMV